MDKGPRYSIVIPSRNRAALLESALRTCVEVDHPNFEILVSDNSSSDDTAGTVAAFADDRIRYTKTSTFVTMGSNFQHGLRHARGEFLIFLGDDDGIMPFSLRALDLAFERYPGVDYVGWHPTGVSWPQPRETRHSLNWLGDLHSPDTETPSQTWRRMARPRSTEALEMGGYNLYHGCIRRSATDAAQAAGVQVFESPIPDLASALRILPFARDKLRLKLPLTATGLSPTSNSWSARAVLLTIQNAGQQHVHSQFAAMNVTAYPDAPLIDYLARRWSRALAYLGPLIDEHLKQRGDLRELDTDIWRLIFLEHMQGVKPDRITGYISDFNEIATWMHERGATGRLTTTVDDVVAYGKSIERLPRYYTKPFRFSDSAVTAARKPMGVEHFDSAGGRILSAYQDGNEVRLKVRAAGTEFTVHDHVRVISAVFQWASDDPARLMIEDPAVFQARMVLSVLNRLAQDQVA